MGEELPKQLRWREFVAVLTNLGYTLQWSKRGAARAFSNPNREPNLVTFHEPHRPDTLRKGTLREYVRKLRLTRQEFLSLLNKIN